MTYIAVVPNLLRYADKYFEVINQRPKQGATLWT